MFINSNLQKPLVYLRPASKGRITKGLSYKFRLGYKTRIFNRNPRNAPYSIIN